MASRYSKLTIRAGWSWNDSIRGDQTRQVQFLLGNVWEVYRRGGGPGEYAVDDPDDITPQREFVYRAITRLIGLLRATIKGRGLLLSVSDPRDVGDDPTHGGFDNGNNTPYPLVEFDIEGLAYDTALDLDFSTTSGSLGWTIVQNLKTIKPVLVYVGQQRNAGIFGSATGYVKVVADGNAGPYTFQWADGPTGDERQNLAAGTYYVTATDGWGESARLTVVIKSDTKLEVQVLTTTSSIRLVPSGGLPPYSYQWADGPTTDERLNLPPAVYRCLVTDARGATRDVEVSLSLASRYWFSGNAITLAVQAQEPDTTAFGCEVWVEQPYLSGNFAQAGNALEQPAIDGGTLFEVQELLEAYVEPLVPSLYPGVTVRQDGAFTRFFLKHYERGPAGIGAGTSVETNYLVRGGLGFEQAALGTWFSSYQQQQLPFLTWEPTTKIVLPDQPEYLAFMPLEELGGWHLKLTLTFADGTNAQPAQPVQPAALAYEVYALGAGPLQLGLPALEAAAGKLVASYQVQVLGLQGQELSEVRTYQLTRKPAPARRYFVYANSLGGWNTLMCRGRGSQELATTTQAADNSRAAGYDPLRGAMTISRRTGLPTLKCYTGARSSEQQRADQDFLLSERVLLLLDGRWVAGQVKDARFTLADDDETRRVLQFDYELPRERYYTPYLTT